MPEWIYGRHAVEEALKAGRRKVFRVLRVDSSKQPGSARDRTAGPRADDSQEGAAPVLPKGVAIERVPASQLDALTHVGHHHQGIAAEVSPFPYIGLSDTISLCKGAGERALVLVLDAVQDPQNFGTLLRTSEAVGVTAVVMLDRRQVAVTPAVSNASAGAVEHLNICLANNLARAIDELRDAGLWVYALQAERGASKYTSTDLRGPLGLVVGSEGRGVGHLVRQHCDGALEIPMQGKIESLNAAVAGSIVLYEALRQRGT
ncbi:MAG TPA: 23S rRNA (guanosine(2251)-2'-O)-methyltransferase RlmB [Chloroflexia bacterium]|nr:23S rRNA (guanosine(2251)-2'-O)-methyltransferase RlmB [Chloroflexia bacterium]